MIPLPLVEEGLDLKALGDILETHENVMGIICVPDTQIHLVRFTQMQILSRCLI